MRKLGVYFLLGSVVCALPVLAQEPAKETETKAAEEPAAQPAAQPTDWWHWDKMTGDWGGARKELADKGITFGLDITQIFQNNAHGGASTNNGSRYSMSADLTLRLDLEKMGLWKGGGITLIAEPKAGNGVNGKVGSLLPVNFDAVKNSTDECEMTLSEWYITQVLLDGKLFLIAGKLWGASAFERNLFANDERTQFMNIGLRNNPLIAPFLPYTNLGVGAVYSPTDWLTGMVAVADTEGKASTTGFNTTFHGPTHTSIIHEWDVKIKPFGKPGTQRVGFVWSSKEFPELQPVSPFRQTGPLMMQLLGPSLFQKVGALLPRDNKPDNVMIYYNFDQYLYTEAEDPTQGIGVFGRFGWARQDVNPAAHFYSFGVGGKGILPERDNDTFGIGYYYLDLSNDLPAMFHSEQGVECYYNVQITPWLHVTPDIQVIANPGGTDAHDCALVWGIRVQMNL